MIIDFAVKTQNDNYGSLSSYNKVNDTSEDKNNGQSFEKVFEKTAGSSRYSENADDKAVKYKENSKEIPADRGKPKDGESKDVKESRDIRDIREKPIKGDFSKEPERAVSDNKKKITPDLENLFKNKIKKAGNRDENKNTEITTGPRVKIKDKAADENEFSTKITESKKYSSDSESIIKDLPDKQVLFKLSDVKKNDINPENITNLFKTVKKSERSEKSEEKLEKKDVKKEIFRIIDLRSRRQENIENNITVNKSSGSEGSPETGDSINNIKFSTDAVSKEFFLNARNWSEPGTFIKTEQTPLQNQVLENLRNHGNSEIIRNAQILLKDNDSGEIKLLMKPDNLGFVRIKLTVEDNNIAGRIIVDNNNVKELFESNLENLLRNFRESGYSTATLDVSVGGGKGGKEGMNNGTRNFAKKIIEDVGEHSLIKSSSYDTRLVDLVI